MPKVYNVKDKDIPKDAVYIGRPSKWGNPYVIGKDGNREDVIILYTILIHSNNLIDDIEELRGKDLVCHCAPKRCHGDVLLHLANSDK